MVGWTRSLLHTSTSSSHVIQLRILIVGFASHDPAAFSIRQWNAFMPYALDRKTLSPKPHGPPPKSHVVRERGCWDRKSWMSEGDAWLRSAGLMFWECNPGEDIPWDDNYHGLDGDSVLSGPWPTSPTWST
jgi:hypothetical protein